MAHRVGFVIGVWDTFHYGHLRLIQRAKEMVDSLIVIVVADEAVKAHKGPNRPVIPFDQRFAIVQSLRYTNSAARSEGFDPYVAVLEELEFRRTHGITTDEEYVFIKGEDQDHIPTDLMIKDLGLKVFVLPRTPDISTTKIIERMR